jgi:putative membrane protein
MTIEIILRYLHFISIFAIVSTLVSEHLLLRPTLTRAEVGRLARIDAVYGMAALTLIIVGLTLWLGSYGKPAIYYTKNWIFHTKLTLFLIVGLLSIYPTVFFIKSRRGDPGDVIAIPSAVFWMLRIELFIVFIIPFLAGLMAHGIGYFGWADIRHRKEIAIFWFPSCLHSVGHKINLPSGSDYWIIVGSVMILCADNTFQESNIEKTWWSVIAAVEKKPHRAELILYPGKAVQTLKATNRFLWMIVLGPAILYFGEPILVPLCFGMLFAMLMTPLCVRLDKMMSRAMSSLVCTIITLVALSVIMGIIIWQLASLVEQFPAIRKQLGKLLISVQHFVQESF